MQIQLVQSEDAQDEHYDDDQADEVDHAVHAAFLLNDDAGSERQLITGVAVPRASARAYANVLTFWTLT